MKKKKVAIVNVFMPPQSIGGATRVVDDNIKILTDYYSDQFDLVGFSTNAYECQAHSLAIYVYRNFRIYQAGALFRENMDWHPKDEKLGELFAQFLDFEKPDVIHFHCVQRLTGSVVEIVRAKGIPYLITVHDAWWISDHQFLVDQMGNVYPDGHPGGDLYFPPVLPEGVSADESIERRIYLKGLLNSAYKSLVVSESFAEIYRKNNINNVVVTRNGVMPRLWKERTPSKSGRLRVAHIGGMSNHKGYHLFKHALSRGGFDNLEALIVDHAHDGGYESHDNWSGVPVTFIGKVPQDRIEDLYARMDVLVAPSIWPESYGLVTREAAAAGVWVVASNVGGIGEDVQSGVNGWCINPNEDDLYSVFCELNKDPDITLGALKGSAVRSSKEQVDQLVPIYQSAMNSSPP